MHAFTTLGLGGFSSHDASFAYFQSPAIEAVAVLFMVVAGMNFAAHFTAWSQKSLAPYAGNLECMAYIKLLAAAVLTVTVYLYAKGVYPIGYPPSGMAYLIRCLLPPQPVIPTPITALGRWRRRFLCCF